MYVGQAPIVTSPPQTGKQCPLKPLYLIRRPGLEEVHKIQWHFHCLAQRASGAKLEKFLDHHPCHFFTRHASLLTNQNATFLGKLSFYICFCSFISTTTMKSQIRQRRIDRLVFQIFNAAEYA